MAEKLFRQLIAAGNAELFDENAQRGIRCDKVNAGDALVGIEGAQEGLREDGAAGSGEGYREVVRHSLMGMSL